MQHLNTLIETARISGISSYTPKGVKSKLSNEELNQFFNCVKDCHPFVFNCDLKNYHVNHESIYEQSKYNIIHAPPFKTFSCEKLGKNIFSIFEFTDEIVNIYCSMTTEISPNYFRSYYLIRSSMPELENHYEVVKFDQNNNTINDILENINRNELGTKSVREKVKIGIGSEKRFHTIRKIVYISPNKYLPLPEPETRDIDWSHRWLVRGHWRSCNGLGKDREGRYSVANYTWVVPHQKGPEHLPLIADKVRLVTA